MKAVSASLDAAIEGHERVVRHNVTVDWDNDGTSDISDIDDMSHKIGQITVDQSLESSLPRQVRVVPGAAVAQLDMALERGNTFRYEVPAAYKSIATASSGSTASRTVAVPRPSGVQSGELVVVALAYVDIVSSNTMLSNANVDWATIAIRGDGVNSPLFHRCEAQCYIRRATEIEPDAYTFVLDEATAWVATAIRIGDPGLMGVHAISSKGQDDQSTTYPILSGVPITTRLDECTVVGIYAAAIPVTGTAVDWTPLDGDTERADVTTTNTGTRCSVAVMTQDSVIAGTYTKRATLNVGATTGAAIQFTLAFAPKLAGDESQHAAWTFSELNNDSPYAGKVRFGRQTQWRVGFHGEDGLEDVQIFTGYTTADDVNSRQRIASITALDNRETMRNTWFQRFTVVAESQVINVNSSFPMYPGLESTWLISQQFAFATFSRPTSSSGNYTPERRGPRGGYGYFASPCMRESSAFWAPLHGSMEAFDGGCAWALTQLSNGVRRRVRFAVGPFVAGTEPAPPSPGFIEAGWSTVPPYPIWTDQRQVQGRFELWSRFPFGTGVLDFYSMNDADTSLSTAIVRLTITAGGQMVLRITMPGGITRTVNGPTVPTDGAWHFYGAHFDSPTGQVIFRIDGTSTTVAFTTYANSVITQTPGWTRLVLTDGAQAAELHSSGGVSSSSFGTVNNPVTTTTGWLNDFTPTAFIDKSENELDVIPFVPTSTDTWTFCSQIADAEFAALYFDGDGFPHFRNTRSDVNTVGQTVQRLLTARSDIKNLAYSSEVSQVANIVDVGYVPHTMFVDQPAWRPQGAIRIPPFGEFTFVLQMPGVVLSLLGFNSFVGNTAVDGTGIVIAATEFNWSTSTTGFYEISITITSTYSGDAYLVDASGQPTPELTASWVAPSSASVAPESRSDNNSIRVYREQPLSIDTTIWRQRQDVAASHAVFLISQLGTPTPVIHDVPIVGDPRIQLGDRDVLQDVNGIGVNGQYRVTGIRHKGSPSGGYEQSLTVREATDVAYWEIDNWDDGTVWGI